MSIQKTYVRCEQCGKRKACYFATYQKDEEGEPKTPTTCPLYGDDAFPVFNEIRPYSQSAVLQMLEQARDSIFEDECEYDEIDEETGRPLTARAMTSDFVDSMTDVWDDVKIAMWIMMNEGGKWRDSVFFDVDAEEQFEGRRSYESLVKNCTKEKVGGRCVRAGFALGLLYARRQYDAERNAAK